MAAWTTDLRRALVGAAVLSCGIAQLPAWADDRPPVTLKLREGSTTVFADSVANFHVQLRSEAKVTGKLVWRQTVENRTISAGEIAIVPGEPADFAVQIPPLKEGVSLKTLLTLELIDDEAPRAEPRATLKHDLWIVDPDPFVERKMWLAELNLALYDPSHDAEKSFEKLKIPFAKIATLGALDRVDRGIVLIGEGIDLARVPAVGTSIYQLIERGVPVMCLAPAKGELAYPGAGSARPVAIRLERCRIVARLDKRLSADAWPEDSQTPIHRFLPTVNRGNLVLRMSDQPAGWPWIEALYPQGTRFILCGYPIIATWKTEPTSRYLLARVLERLDRTKRKWSQRATAE